MVRILSDCIKDKISGLPWNAEDQGSECCTQNRVSEYVHSGSSLSAASYRLTQPAQYHNYYSPAPSTLAQLIMVSISLQPESGYVFLVVAATAILNLYQMMKVS